MKIKVISGILFLAVCYFPLFLHLDSLPLYIYDESRLAMNALEMSEHMNLMVPTFEGKPDMWNTKPPLMVILQMFCMKVLGYNELAVRLPAALSGLGIIFLLLYFSHKVLHNVLIGVFASLVLISNHGFIIRHVTRTGDYDTLLCFWILLYLMSFFVWLYKSEPEGRNKYLWITALSVALAVLTKSVAGLIPLPVLLGFVIYEKKLLDLLKNPHFYSSMFTGLFLILAYYLGRESLNPGYLNAVWENELGGRYLESLEGHHGSAWFYFHMLWETKFYFWLPFLLLTFLVVKTEAAIVKKFAVYVFCTALFLFLIFSFGQTKLIWYDAPIYPLLSVWVAVSIHFIYKQVVKTKNVEGKEWTRMGFAMLFILVLFAVPYMRTVSKHYHAKVADPRNDYGEFFKQNKDLNELAIFHDTYNSSLDFYLEVAKKSNKNFYRVKLSEMKAGQKYLVCESEYKHKMFRYFKTEVERKTKYCKYYHLVKRK